MGALSARSTQSGVEADDVSRIERAEPRDVAAGPVFTVGQRLEVRIAVERPVRERVASDGFGPVVDRLGRDTGRQIRCGPVTGTEIPRAEGFRLRRVGSFLRDRNVLEEAASSS